MWPASIKGREFSSLGERCEHVIWDTLVSTHAGDSTAQLALVVLVLHHIFQEQGLVRIELVVRSDVVCDLVYGPKEQVVGQVLSDTRKIDKHRNVELRELIGRANSGDHEELRRTECTSRKNNFAGSIDSEESCSVVGSVLNAGSSEVGRIGEKNAGGKSTGDDVEIGTVSRDGEEARSGRATRVVGRVDGEWEVCLSKRITGVDIDFFEACDRGVGEALTEVYRYGLDVATVRDL